MAKNCLFLKHAGNGSFGGPVNPVKDRCLKNQGQAGTGRIINGDLQMFYLCLSFTVLWVATFAYLLYLNGQIKDIRKRLQARTQNEL